MPAAPKGAPTPGAPAAPLRCFNCQNDPRPLLRILDQAGEACALICCLCRYPALARCRHCRELVQQTAGHEMSCESNPRRRYAPNPGACRHCGRFFRGVGHHEPFCNSAPKRKAHGNAKRGQSL